MFKETENLNSEGVENIVNSETIRCKKNLVEYRIKDRLFSRSIEIKDINPKGENDTLEFNNCCFSNIKLSEIGCPNVRFINCTIKGEIIIYQGKLEQVIFRECNQIGRIILEDLNDIYRNKPKLKIVASNVDELKIIDSKLDRIVFDDVDSHCNSISFLKSGGVETINISCHVDCIYTRELPEIVLSKEGKIDTIELERINKKTLLKYEKNTRDNNGDKYLEDDFERYKSVVVASYESFENRKMFIESDICLFEIRRLGIIIKKCNKNVAKKAFYSIVKLFAENCFGWGIRIINNIITTLSIITGFACIYFGISYRYEKGLDFAKCFEISINRFFIIGAKEYERTFLPFLDSIESIMGVILLTVITGVLVRKIIR